MDFAFLIVFFYLRKILSINRYDHGVEIVIMISSLTLHMIDNVFFCDSNTDADRYQHLNPTFWSSKNDAVLAIAHERDKN